jgi:hypothetical protein
MKRLSILALIPIFFFAAIGCGGGPEPPEREQGKTAATEREGQVGGKFMRPKGTPEGDKKK